MRSIIYVLLCFGAISGAVRAQDDIQLFNERRQQIQRSAMMILGGWSVANLAAAGIQYPASDGRSRYFHEMNLAWSGVNLAIAGWGYWNARKTPENLTLAQSIAKQHNLEKLLLFNAGLDVAYIITGAYLISRGNDSSENGERYQGYGTAIIFQGGFLFAFDVLTYWFQNRNNRKLTAILQRLQFSQNSIGIRLTF